MPFPPLTVLLVDDHEPHRYAIARALRAAGHTVLEAGTGAEALALAQQSPQVALLDVNLPDIDGFEICRRLKADPRTHAMPVIFISATCPPWQGHQEATAVGGMTFLIHPVDTEQLLPIIAGAVRKSENAQRASAECIDLPHLL